MAKKSLPYKEMIDTPDEFESFYKLNQPLIYRFMFWRTQDEMLAEDLTSNVFEKAWRTRKHFVGGSAKAWVYRIAHTTLIDQWRKKKELVDDGETIAKTASTATPQDEVFDQQLTIAALNTAVRALPKDMRAVITLRFIEGKSTRETGTQLNISEANVRVIQYRALQKLRKLL